MNRYSFFEVFIGVFIILATILSSVYFFSIRKYKDSNFPYYTLNVDFRNIEGIAINSDVNISGVRIGYVKNIKLEKDYFVSLEIAIKKDINIPDDSRISISSSGLLSQRHLNIEPGLSTKSLSEGEKIIFSYSQLNFEDLINKIIYMFSLK